MSAIGLSDGRVVLGRIRFLVTNPDGKRKVEPKFNAENPVTLDPKGKRCSTSPGP